MDKCVWNNHGSGGKYNTIQVRFIQVFIHLFIHLFTLIHTGYCSKHISPEYGHTHTKDTVVQSMDKRIYFGNIDERTLKLT